MSRQHSDVKEMVAVKHEWQTTRSLRHYKFMRETLKRCCLEGECLMWLYGFWISFVMIKVKSERERVIVRSTREKNQKPRNHPSEQAPSVFGVRVSAVKSNQHQVNVY